MCRLILAGKSPAKAWGNALGLRWTSSHWRAATGAQMSTYTPWDRAADLYGLLKAAAALVPDARHDVDAQEGLSAVLNMAGRLSAEVLSDAEKAEKAAEARG